MKKRQQVEHLLQILFRRKKLNHLGIRTKQQRERWRKTLRSIRRLRRMPGVVGFGLGRRTKNKQARREICLKVYVERKVDPGELRRSVIVPAKIFLPWANVTVSVDVEETGLIEPAFGTTPQILNSIEGGRSIRHKTGTPGTLGCLALDQTKQDRMCILSCNHVIANSGFAQVGDEVLLADSPNQPIVAKLLSWNTFDFSPDGANVDAAVADPINPADFSRNIRGIGTPQGIRSWDSLTADVENGESIRMSGGASGLVNGRLAGKHFHFAPSYNDPNAAGQRRPANFVNQLLCSFPVQGGDSGSVVLDRSGNVIGQIHHRTAEGGIASPIEDVLNALNLRIAT